MSDFERRSAGKPAGEPVGKPAGRGVRRTLPARSRPPGERQRLDVLQRHLGAVAAAAARASERTPSPEEAAAPRSAGERRRTPARPRVRDVMSAPAVAVPGDMPFPDVARTLSREHLSAVPVVDAEDHVIGVVSESDLLAKAAVMTEPHRHGSAGRTREHRLYGRGRGETAATLMTFPPVTARPWQPVGDAAWTAARSRVKRLPVTDHHDRLVGVVSRCDLLRALVRDDEEVREEVEVLIRREFGLDPGAYRLAVEGGVVAVTHWPLAEYVPEVLASVRDVEGVVDAVDRLDGVRPAGGARPGGGAGGGAQERW
ncbi:CBS domain-containing protein [Streptomyces sp. DH37]|uniref:CBS domain-containing protein n=1 Tax=Streptomyces sp. DH37 TaxID=3040122 RepID=UPI0024427CF4|nr:CBS domain-containing protein [Streptomyces sp. DH37]MDG9702499.1 CBS domain-containing protein [Streptomyces sp. DH37]